MIDKETLITCAPLIAKFGLQLKGELQMLEIIARSAISENILL